MVQAITGDGIPEFLAADTYATVSKNANQGRAHILNGKTEAVYQTLENPDAQAEGLFGSSVALLGDQIAVGAAGATVGGNANQGWVYVFSQATRTLLYTIDDRALEAGAQFGISMAAVGDINGDGLPDLAILRLSNAAEPGTQVRQVCVFSGKTGVLLMLVVPPDTPPLDPPTTLWVSPVNVGDVNGDGMPDLGAGGFFEGRFFVFSLHQGTTPVGSSVTVQPLDANPVTPTNTAPFFIAFDQVTAEGTTTVATLTSPPAPPPGFMLGDSVVHYDVQTTATYSGQINVCLNYSGVTVPDESALRLYHWTGSNWEDATFGTPVPGSQRICGVVTSLSPFATLQPR